MKASVEAAIEELRRQFDGHVINVEEDGTGGAYFTINDVDIGAGFTPSRSWLGGHITNGFPYADIYPMYIDGALVRAGQQAFTVPVVPIPAWRGRPAIQVSRVNRNAAAQPQSASLKVLRVLDYLQRY
jgi:hypothetical protein